MEKPVLLKGTLEKMELKGSSMKTIKIKFRTLYDEISPDDFHELGLGLKKGESLLGFHLDLFHFDKGTPTLVSEIKFNAPLQSLSISSNKEEVFATLGTECSLSDFLPESFYNFVSIAGTDASVNLTVLIPEDLQLKLFDSHPEKSKIDKLEEAMDDYIQEDKQTKKKSSSPAPALVKS